MNIRGHDQPPIIAALSTVRLLVGIAGIWVLLLGTSIVATGDERWTHDPRFATALQLPGAPESWGAAAISCGIATLVGCVLARRAWIVGGLLASGCWAIALSSAYLVEFIGHGRGDAGAPLGYLVGAAVFLVLAAAHVRRRG